MIACIARVGSPSFAFVSRTLPMFTMAAADAPTNAMVRGPTDLPARSRSQPIAEPRSAAMAALMITRN